MHILPKSRKDATDKKRTQNNGGARRPRGDLRFILPPIGLLFCAFAFLVHSLVATEIRSAKILEEAEATRIVSVLLEGVHAASGGEFVPHDTRVLGFGLYKQNDQRVFGYGAAPDTFDSSPSEETFTYDDTTRTLTLVRPLFLERRHKPEDLPRSSETSGDDATRPSGASGADSTRPQGISGEDSTRPSGTSGVEPENRRRQDFLYLSLDAREYYRTRELLEAAVVISPIFVLSLGALFVLLILKNIKYRAIAEKRETLAFLGESARTLVHEIRNPLSAIRLQMGVLRRKLPADDIPEIGAIEEETRRLDLLVRRISGFLKNPAGSPVRVDLGDFLRDFAVRRPGGFDLESVEEGVVVSFDPDLLQSVLENLIRNALESYPEDASERKATVSLVTHGATAIMTVEDRGKGIQDAVRGRLFDPFFTDKPQGSGIGLPLARRFVQAAGGKLSLATRKGGGTTARIKLPLAEES